MAILVNSFTTKGLLNKIHDAKCNDWSSGLAWKVHQGLVKEYLPTNFVTKVELARKTQGLKLKKKVNPLKLKEKIATIKCKYRDMGEIMNEVDNGQSN